MSLFLWYVTHRMEKCHYSSPVGAMKLSLVGSSHNRECYWPALPTWLYLWNKYPWGGCDQDWWKHNKFPDKHELLFSKQPSDYLIQALRNFSPLPKFSGESLILRLEWDFVVLIFLFFFFLGRDVGRRRRRKGRKSLRRKSRRKRGLGGGI